MATVTAYWHKGGGWWTVRVNDQRATVRGKAAAAAAAAVMRQAETDTDGGQGVAYLLRKRGGSRVDLDQAARGRFRWAGEYWQRCGDRWGWGPSETAHRFTATERAQAVADSSVPQVSAEWVTVYVAVPA